MEEQKFCLRWDGYQSSITSVFDRLRRDGQLLDVTLSAEGHRMRAHRVLLAACSPYLRDLLTETPCDHLVLVLRDTPAADLRALLEFMYCGSVNVTQGQLASFIRTAETLQVRGLSGDEDKSERPERRASSSSSGVPSGGSRSSAGREPPPTPPPAPPPAEPPPSPLYRPHSEPVAVKLEPLSGSLSGAAAAGVKAERLSPDRDGEYGAPLHADEVLGYVAALERGSAQHEAAQHEATQHEAAHSSPGRPASVTAGTQHPCDICGKVYKYRISLLAHRKHHEGRTSCYVCGHTSSTVQNLRQHLRFVHRLSADEVARRTGLQRTRLSSVTPPPQHAGRWPQQQQQQQHQQLRQQQLQQLRQQQRLRSAGHAGQGAGRQGQSVSQAGQSVPQAELKASLQGRSVPPTGQPDAEMKPILQDQSLPQAGQSARVEEQSVGAQDQGELQAGQSAESESPPTGASTSPAQDHQENSAPPSVIELDATPPPAAEDAAEDAAEEAPPGEEEEEDAWTEDMEEQ